MNRIQSFKAYLIYRKAVMMANKAHAQTGNRYFVLPCISPKIFLIAADRKNFRELQRKHYINESWKFEQAKEKAFYYTADRRGNGAPTDEVLKFRQVMYQYWFEVRLSEKKAERKARRNRPIARKLLSNIMARRGNE